MVNSKLPLSVPLNAIYIVLNISWGILTFMIIAFSYHPQVASLKDFLE